MSDLMSNVLKVNQPVNSGFDNNNVRNNPITPGDTQIQNVIDPSTVVRPDGKTEAEDKRFAFSSESNYGNFITNMKEMPGLLELFSKIFVTDMKTMVNSGLGEDFAQKISEFMEMMKMDESQLLSFIKSQSSEAGKFGGVFFQALQEVLNGTGSLELRTGILDFLKHYSDMASSEHLLNNILMEIKEVMPYLFKADSDELAVITEHLLRGNEGEPKEEGHLLERLDENIRNNSRVLKEELLPFFSKYVSRTHDFGKTRDLMTLITLNISRYVNGGKDTVIQSFEKLLQFGDFRERLGEIKGDNLEAILNRLIGEVKNGEQNPWTEKFISLIRAGLSGDGGYEGKAIFRNIMNSMLLNESVYMPLIHTMIPVNLNGNIMFSEIWADPDAENGYDERGEEKRGIRMLIKFDIKDVGFFDVVLNYMDGNVDLMIAYPPRLAAAEKDIRKEIGKIVTDNGLSFQSIEIARSLLPITLMEVFPKISEGRNSVNVRI